MKTDDYDDADMPEITHAFRAYILAALFTETRKQIGCQQ